MAHRRLPTSLLHGSLALLFPLLLSSTTASAAWAAQSPEAPSAPATSRAALREGNRLYRQGNLEGAVAAYQAGASRSAAGAVDPLLAYNLATALHHLGRLPEAVLWYRRAATGQRDDPWLEENLERARTELGAQRLGPPRPLAPALRHPWLAGALAAACAWVGLLLALAGPARGRGRRSRWLAGGFLAAGLLLWFGGQALSRFGPRAAVLLDACGGLPAGSEVWVEPEEAGRFRVTGSDAACEAAAVGLVRPRRAGLGLLVM